MKKKRAVNNPEFIKWLKKCELKRRHGRVYYVYEAELLTAEEAYGQWLKITTPPTP